MITPGTRMGRYEIRSHLGAGGMGEVYLAQDTILDREVALKILPDAVAADPDRMKRFLQEAKSASALNHPNIITIYEIDQTSSPNFIASEFINGQTLRARIKAQQMSFGEALDVVIQIASALSAAHDSRIVHRDIKPENIIIRRDGIVKVLDFGLARVMAKAADSEAETQSPLTTPGTILGTVPYMSPEQVKGETVDARTDIFSFGVVLYEMVSGRQPFASQTPAETISAILHHQPLTLLHYAPDLPEELARITGKCLEKDRKLRYQNISEVRVELQRLKRDTESVPALITATPEAKTEDAPPIGDKAVYAFLGLFALAFTFAGAAALLRSEAVWRVVSAWVVAVIFFVAGIRWPKIKLWLGDRFRSRQAKVSPDRTVSVPPVSSGVAFTPRRFIVPLALVVMAFLAAGYFYYPHSANERPSEIKSLAVLPLKSLDTGDNYLGLGIADAAIRKISQTGRLIVRPTSAVRRYTKEDTDALAAAKELGVDSVLEGSFQRADDRLRVSVNLLRSSDGTSLWSEKFDLRMTDIFTIEDTVAQQVASHLRLQLDVSQQAQLTKRYTSNPIAYELYLKGVYAFDQRVSAPRALIDTTIDFFKQAIQVDPNFALAHAELAYTYATMSTFLDPTQPAWANSAKEEINRALELDPQLAEIHLARFQLLFGAEEGYQAEAAIREVLLAQQLNPNVGHAELGYLFMHVGLGDAGARELQRASEIDPTSGFAKDLVKLKYLVGCKYDEYFADRQIPYSDSPPPISEAWYLMSKGRLDEAGIKLDEMAGRSDSIQLLPKKALLTALKGDFRSAEAAVPSILNLHPAKDPLYHHATYDIACIFALAGKSTEAVKWLRETAANGFHPYSLFECDPNLNRIRQSPEFVEFMVEMKALNEKYQLEFSAR